jgi:hypothetical protein
VLASALQAAVHVCGAYKYCAQVGEARMGLALAEAVRWATQETVPRHWELASLGLKALALMAAHRNGKGAMHQAQLREANACKIVVAALRQALHDREGEAVVQGLRCVWKIMVANYAELLELGTAELIVRALRVYGRDYREVCLPACSVLAFFVVHERGQTLLLRADDDCCGDVLAVARAFPQDMEVLSRVCLTICHMCGEPVAKKKLLAFDAGAVLLGAMQAFPQHRAIHLHSCTAITQLSVGSDTWMRALVDQKAQATLFQALTVFFRDPDLLQRVLLALGCLSAHRLCRVFLKDKARYFVELVESVPLLARDWIFEELLGLLLTQVLEADLARSYATVGLGSACVRALQVDKPRVPSRLAILLLLRMMQALVKADETGEMVGVLTAAGVVKTVALVILPIDDDPQATEMAEQLLSLLGVEAGLEEAYLSVPWQQRLLWTLRKMFRRRR